MLRGLKLYDMKADIKIHETFENADKYSRVAKVILHEVFECSWTEFNKIRSDYESGRGKYGIKNKGLDHCWYL